MSLTTPDKIRNLQRKLYCKGYGSRGKAYGSVDQYVFERVRRFLTRRHKVQGHGNRRFTFDVIHRELGVLCLQRLPRAAPVACLAVKPVGKPDAGNRHVRFDARGWETGRWPKGPKLPRPSSTLPSRTSLPPWTRLTPSHKLKPPRHDGLGNPYG
jgi:hypothetical protein